MSNIEQNLAKILSAIYGEEVRGAIHDAIHECYEDGKAGAVDLVAREQIANLVTNEGTTEKDSELVDIRVGSEGVTYDSAGDAIRYQFEAAYNSLLKEYPTIEGYKKEIVFTPVKPHSIEINTYWDYTSQTKQGRTGYAIYNIYLKNNVKYLVYTTTNTNIAAINFFTHDNKFIKRFPSDSISGPSTGMYTIEVPREAYYAIINALYPASKIPIVEATCKYVLDGSFIENMEMSSLMDFPCDVIEDKYLTYFGTFAESEAWKIYKVPVSENTMYDVKMFIISQVRGVGFFDINDRLISMNNFVDESPSSQVVEKKVVAPSNSTYMYISVEQSNVSNVYYEESKYDIIENKYLNYYGNLQDGDLWRIYKIPVSEGNFYKVRTYCISQVRGVGFFDINDRLISMNNFVDESPNGEWLEKVVTAPNMASYMYISVDDNNIDKFTYEHVYLRKLISSTPDIHYVYNHLYGKKLVSSGDSLVEGVYAGDDENGEPMTYAYRCAKKHNMTFINDGISGSTMANISVSGSFRNGYSVNRYKNIPSDTDYLTILFGWNDIYYGPVSLKDDYCQEQYGKYYSDCTSEEKEACDSHENWEAKFLGEEDSLDNKTWSGAWNIVLDYLIRNHTNMKIGVIIPYLSLTNSNSKPLRNRLVDICKKFGVPYIDGQNTNEWPSTGYSTDLSPSMATFYQDTRTEDGLHDNALGHILKEGPYTNFIYGI